MGIECAECERDLRGGHDPSCSRVNRPEQWAWFDEDDEQPHLRWCGCNDAAQRCSVCPRRDETASR